MHTAQNPTQLHGPAPLTPRLEPWMRELLADADACHELMNEFSSPLNVLDTSSLSRNVSELSSAAADFDVNLFVQIARKANKALAIVDEARDQGFGIDVGSEAELAQVLARGVAASRVVVTAAVKPRSLLELCLDSGALLALDNLDEATLFARLADERGVIPRVALRLQPPLGEQWVPSRFGEQVETWSKWLAERPHVHVIGLHFHLHGYSAAARAAMLRVVFHALDVGAFGDHDIEFVDIGGGIPMSYLDDGDEWENFWALHRERLTGPNPLTWQANPLTNVYPYHQKVIRGEWLRELLAEAEDGVSVAKELNDRGLQLRLEPGRAVLDGVGMTLARVAFRKHTSDGTFVVGLEMNRTQCRSTSDDFLVDPLLVRMAPNDQADAELRETFFVGAYCIESELLLTRRICVPADIGVGDIIAFPNTGGYLMHILESASHQIQLARNVSRRRSDEKFELDPIDVSSVR